MPSPAVMSSRILFVDLVAMPEGPHPIPFRTRSLSPPGPMVLRLKARESRSSPGLPSGCVSGSPSSRILSAGPSRRLAIAAGWSSPVARQAHNLKVIGSNPIPAPKLEAAPVSSGGRFRLTATPAPGPMVRQPSDLGRPTSGGGQDWPADAKAQPRCGRLRAGASGQAAQRGRLKRRAPRRSPPRRPPPPAPRRSRRSAGPAGSAWSRPRRIPSR